MSFGESNRQTLEEAHALFRRGNYREAAKHYAAGAEQGDADSLVALGWMLQNGLGVGKDLRAAQDLYERAVGAGSTVAEFQLGMLHRQEGRYQEALLWLQRAAEQNYAPALYRLAHMYRLGEGVRRDPALYQEYLQRAAKLGHLFARRDLARRSMTGKSGVFGILRACLEYWRTNREAARLVATGEIDDRVR